MEVGRRPGARDWRRPLPLCQGLIKMDDFTREYFRLRPYYTQHLLWTLEMQGDRIELKQHLTDYKISSRPTRNACTEFTARARMRMLKFVAGVDWGRCKGGMFVTLTYPDSVLFRTKGATNIHRYVIQRYMEKYLSKQICLLWRIEWKRRLSGCFKGRMCPHVHMIVFVDDWIPKEDLREMWRKTIGTIEYVQVDVQPLEDAKKAGIYVSKYCAKNDLPTSLDKVSYLNKPGRHWGYCRKPLIPLQPVVKFVDLSWRCVADLERIQRTYNNRYDTNKDAGFTMLGERVSLWRDAILQCCLADGKVPLYDDLTKGEQSSPVP